MAPLPRGERGELTMRGAVRAERHPDAARAIDWDFTSWCCVSGYVASDPDVRHMFECLLAKLGSNAPRADLEAGVLANVSIGYSLGKMRKLPAGSDGIPIMQVEEYKIKEISLVGIGADEGAQVRKYDCEVRQ